MKHAQRILIIISLLLPSIGWSASSPEQQLQALKLQRNGLINLLAYMDAYPAIFNRPATANELLSGQQKQKIISLWGLFLDYMTVLDRISEQTNEELYTAATLAHYRFALEFIERVQRDPEIVKLLDQKHKQLNLPKNFYRRFQNEMLGEYRTRQFEDARTGYQFIASRPVYQTIKADLTALHRISRFRLLAGNQKRLLQYSLYQAYYPLQKGIARGMGKIKVWRFGKTLITPKQALNYSANFEPGDFYLTRKEWRMTNVGIPGFWTHSALYIGTPAERALYFNSEAIQTWVNNKGANSFEQLLRSTSRIYAQHTGFDALGDIRVLEALDDGVIFNSIESSLDADGAAAFRPRLSKLEKAKAIYNAFRYAGRPYDFHFDFDTDDALVCSEVIYKAYLHSEEQQGIRFPLHRSVGKKMLTPNDIAKWFDDTYQSSQQQLDLVMFVDSNEHDGVAFQSNVEHFLGSWQRPDWYIFQQPVYQHKDLLAQSE